MRKATIWEKIKCWVGFHSWEPLGAWACDPGTSYRQFCCCCPNKRYWVCPFPALDRHVPEVRRMAGIKPRRSPEKMIFVFLVCIMLGIILYKLFIHGD